MKEHSVHFNEERDYPQDVIFYLDIAETFINTYEGSTFLIITNSIFNTISSIRHMDVFLFTKLFSA